MLEICFALSAAVFGVSVVVCGVWNYVLHRKQLAKYPVLRPINVFSVCCVIAFLLLFIPQAFDDNEQNIIVAVIAAIRYVMDNLSFGNSLSTVTSAVFGSESVFATDVIRYQFLYLCFLSFFVPVLAARAAVTVFRNAFTQLRFSLNRTSSFCIFSELNERSVQLAEGISQDKKTKVIFTGIDRTSASDRYLVEQARKMNAMLTKRTVNGLHISDRFSKSPVCICFISADENKNIKDAVDKFAAVEKINREIRLCIFSVSESAQAVTDALNARAENGRVRAELFNEAQRMAYTLLFEHPLYEVNSDADEIRVMILGAGTYGLEVAKAVAWCAFLPSKKVSIRIFDRKNKEEVLGFPFLNLTERLQKIGTRCDLSFCCCDVFSTEFDEQRFDGADYIFVALGDDDSVNLAAAMQMRRLYARQEKTDGFVPETRRNPKIFVRLNSNVTKEIALSLHDPDTIPYATLEKVYRSCVLNDWQVDSVAQCIHAAYYGYRKMRYENDQTDALVLFAQGKADYCRQSEINKRSSRAAAVHCKYKLHALGIGLTPDALFSEQAERLLQQHTEELMRLEHDRWNTFQMLDGWDPWDPQHLIPGQHKCIGAKLHAYLAPYDALPDIAQTVYGGDADPSEYDRVILGVMRYAFACGTCGRICDADIRRLFNSFSTYRQENNR